MPLRACRCCILGPCAVAVICARYRWFPFEFILTHNYTFVILHVKPSVCPEVLDHLLISEQCCPCTPDSQILPLPLGIWPRLDGVMAPQNASCVRPRWLSQAASFRPCHNKFFCSSFISKGSAACDFQNPVCGTRGLIIHMPAFKV